MKTSQQVFWTAAALAGLGLAAYVWKRQSSTKQQDQQTQAAQQVQDQGTTTTAVNTTNAEQQTAQKQQQDASTATSQVTTISTSSGSEKSIDDYFDDIRTGIFTINAHKIVHAIKKILQLDANNFEAHVIKILCEEINHQSLRNSSGSSSRVIATEHVDALEKLISKTFAEEQGHVVDILRGKSDIVDSILPNSPHSTLVKTLLIRELFADKELTFAKNFLAQHKNVNSLDVAMAWSCVLKHGKEITIDDAEQVLKVYPNHVAAMLAIMDKDHTRAKEMHEKIITASPDFATTLTLLS